MREDTVLKYKIVATDFDGTLLSSNKLISRENMEALRKCRAAGCKVVGITARNLSSVKSICNIGLFDYLIINNGTYIYDVKKQNGEFLSFFSLDFVKQITNDFINISDGIDYCTRDNYYSYKKKIEQYRPFHLHINDISEISGYVARMNIWGASNEQVCSMKKLIEKKYADECKCIEMLDTDNNSNKRWVAINPKDCNKAVALKILADNLGYSTEEVMFFGDATNDIEIIQAAGLGIAMGNAVDEVKKIADDITLNNDENGIAYYINKALNL